MRIQHDVRLLNFTPLEITMRAIRQCWDSFDRSDRMGQKDLDLIYKVGITNNHASTLEHVVYTFQVSGISRACLQEVVRHRLASYSVKSTRYTLKELKNTTHHEITKGEVMDSFLVRTGDSRVDAASEAALLKLRDVLRSGVKNDVAKYCLPEAYKTSLVFSINLRSLMNFLTLRSSKSALWEIRDLAQSIFDSLPEQHKYLFDKITTLEK